MGTQCGERDAKSLVYILPLGRCRSEDRHFRTEWTQCGSKSVEKGERERVETEVDNLGLEK